MELQEEAMVIDQSSRSQRLPSIPICLEPDEIPSKPNFTVPFGACDCHAHIFGPVERYSLSPDRGYTPPKAGVDAYRRLLAILGFERAIIVTPGAYGTDNACTEEVLLSANGTWRGIALLDSEVDEREVERLHNAGFRGVRFNLRVNPNYASGPGTLGQLQQLADRIGSFGWHVQLALNARDLGTFAPFLSQLPIDFVVDHMGFPSISKGVVDPGFHTLLSLMQNKRCWVKLSGAYHLSNQEFPHMDVGPFARALIDIAPERLVWATNWPHTSSAHRKGKNPGTVIPNDGDLLNLLELWAPNERVRHQILVDNPTKLYFR